MKKADENRYFIKFTILVILRHKYKKVTKRYMDVFLSLTHLVLLLNNYSWSVTWTGITRRDSFLSGATFGLKLLSFT